VAFIAAFGFVYAYGIVFGLAMTGSRARRLYVLAIAAVGLAAPFALRSESMLLRGLVAFGVAIGFLRLVDLASERTALTPLRRIMHATATVDLRRVPHTARTLHVPSLVRFLLLGSIVVVAYTFIANVPPADPLMRIARWFAGCVAAYAQIDAFAAFATLVFRGLGYDVPRFHDDPIKSRTVAEFWGERWNLIVGRWLRAHCFMPLARKRRPLAGLAAAFAASTVLHVYLAWAVLDAQAAGMWALFFAAQIPILLVERALRVSTWPHWSARIWTIGVLCAVSPLFVAPVIRGFEAMR
jgi:D-alanyl-lipoteichoic acid acyltransferase DltB (MBOAT superfamily)